MNLESAILAVLSALDAEQIPYLLVGSLSSSFYGVQRSTQDADLVIELGDKSIAALVSHLPPSLTLDRQQRVEMITGTTVNVIKAGQYSIELFRLSADLHDQERFARRQKLRAFDRDVFIPTPEDVIVTKLRWQRRKDDSDIQGILLVRGNQLDWSYINHWASVHGTAEHLARLRSQIGQ